MYISLATKCRISMKLGEIDSGRGISPKDGITFSQKGFPITNGISTPYGVKSTIGSMSPEG